MTVGQLSPDIQNENGIDTLTAILASILHDTIEDTETSIDEIE